MVGLAISSVWCILGVLNKFDVLESFGPVHVQLTLVTRSLLFIDLILIDEEGDGDQS